MTICKLSFTNVSIGHQVQIHCDAFFACSIRTGEAQVPGPVLGNMNPTGLAGKAADLAQLPQGVYAVRETHLTTLRIPRFKQELVWRKAHMKLHHGAPAPPKNQSIRTVGGKQTGVAFVSSYPCRVIPHHWSSSEYATGRRLTAAAFVQGRWITMGIMCMATMNVLTRLKPSNTLANCCMDLPAELLKEPIA